MVELMCMHGFFQFSFGQIFLHFKNLKESMHINSTIPTSNMNLDKGLQVNQSINHGSLVFKVTPRQSLKHFKFVSLMKNYGSKILI